MHQKEATAATTLRQRCRWRASVFLRSSHPRSVQLNRWHSVMQLGCPLLCRYQNNGYPSFSWVTAQTLTSHNPLILMDHVLVSSMQRSESVRCHEIYHSWSPYHDNRRKEFQSWVMGCLITWSNYFIPVTDDCHFWVAILEIICTQPHQQPKHPQCTLTINHNSHSNSQ